MSVFSQSDVRVENSHILIKRRQVIPSDNHNKWFSVEAEDEVNGDFFDAVLMRKDPPFNMEYIYATYLLEMIEANGTPVLNKPGSIRDCNEKLFALRFPECVPEHIVSKDQDKLREFHAKHGDVIYKPLDGMGGTSIFRAGEKRAQSCRNYRNPDPKRASTDNGPEYIPAIVDGDTRILLINGDPVPYGLARIPLAGETRGNLLQAVPELGAS